MGPYLSERQWGTVREDYSEDGNAWDYFPHDQARSRAYRWGEDGLAGISDDKQLLCFALALWNGKDPVLKERLFGLINREGNHGEDVKEYYFYLDSTPTHSYMKYLYIWSWRKDTPRPELRQEGAGLIGASHPDLGQRFLHAENAGALLFTENETNAERIFGRPNRTPFVKDGINNYIVNGQQQAVNPDGKGTKAAAHYSLTVPGGQSRIVRLRLTDTAPDTEGGYGNPIRPRLRFRDECAPARGGRVLRLCDPEVAHR